MNSQFKRTYVDTPNGQIHVRIWNKSLTKDIAPIICLPPAPFGGAAYETIAPLIADDKPVIAIDYPGYGMSDVVSNSPTINDYAQAGLAVAETLARGKRPTLLGFHTGCLVAAEAAIVAPQKIDRLLLIDVPCFDADRRRAIAEEFGSASELGEELSMLEGDWTAYVTNRLDNVPLSRAYQLFVDQASAGQLRTAAFRATLQYACDEQLPKVDCPTDVVATKAGLYEESLQAASLIPGCQLSELPDITVSVLEQQATTLATHINQLM